MRFRNFSGNTTSKTYRERWWSNQPRYDYDRNALVTRSTSSDGMVDVVTPKFLTIRNNGGIVCSPMYRETLYHDIDHTIFAAEGNQGAWPIKWDDHLTYGLTEPVARTLQSTDISALDARLNQFSRETDLAITRAHANVDVSEMMLLASLGELPETLNWMKNLIIRAIRVTRAFQSKAERAKILRTLLYSMEEADGKKAIRHATRRYEGFVQLLKSRAERATKRKSSVVDDFSNLWLEYRYAIRPLISDMQNACNALNAIIESKRATARGHEYTSGKREEYVNRVFDNGVTHFETRTKISEEESIRARAGVLFEIEERVVSLLTIFGLDQPIESMYELIPFSFILDWFFSIGDLLQSWFKSSGLSVLTSWVSLDYVYTRTEKLTSFTLRGATSSWVFNLKEVTLGSSHQTVHCKRRLPNPAIPLLPRCDVKLSLAKIIDLGMIGRALTGGNLTEVTKRSLQHA